MNVEDIKTHFCNQCCKGKQYYYITECVLVALVIQYIKRKNRSILPVITSLVIVYF